MGWIRGNQLSADDQHLVKTAFVNRYTREHVPDWATGRLTQNGNPFPPHFDSDDEWLAHSQFQTLRGRLSINPMNCRSSLIWPDGIPAELHSNARALYEASAYPPKTPKES